MDCWGARIEIKRAREAAWDGLARFSDIILIRMDENALTYSGGDG
jgi:hypothetical protein